MNKLFSTQIKAVLFDWDDTLVGTIEAKWAQHKHVALTRYNRKLVDEDIRKHWGKPLHELASVLYAGDDFRGAIDHMMEMDDQGLFPKKLFKQTIGVLERLRATNILVGVVTSHLKIGFERDLVALGVPPVLFDYIQTADAMPVYKPDPGVFAPAKLWLAAKCVPDIEVLYVGDAWIDAEAATGAGFQFVGVGTGLVSVEEFESKGIVAIRQLDQLMALA